MPLDSVELSAWPLVGVWLSSTLSSSRCLEPALGKVALLNSTVFVLWIKLHQTTHTSHMKHMTSPHWATKQQSQQTGHQDTFVSFTVI